MSTPLLRETWHDNNDLILLLTCEGDSCLAEITMPSRRGPAVDVDVLLQPRDRRGLAVGSPIVAHSQQVHMQPLPDHCHSIGRFWLPSGMSQESAQKCYFRIRHIVSSTSDLTDSQQIRTFGEETDRSAKSAPNGGGDGITSR